MVLKARLESLEGIPEAIAGEYSAQEDGSFLLSVEADGGYELANTESLKSALQKERKAARDASSALKRFGDLDPDEARTALEKLANFDEKNFNNDEEVKRKIESVREQMLKVHKDELTGRDTRIQKLSGKVSEFLVDAAATQAIAERKGNAKLLLPHIRNRVKVIETDDDFKVEVVNHLGEPAVNGEGKNISVSELVKQMEKEFPEAFAGSGSSGSGGGSGSGAGAGSGNVEGNQYVISREDARNPMKYRRAKEEAKKQGLRLVMSD